MQRQQNDADCQMLWVQKKLCYKWRLTSDQYLKYTGSKWDFYIWVHQKIINAMDKGV